MLLVEAILSNLQVIFLKEVYMAWFTTVKTLRRVSPLQNSYKRNLRSNKKGFYPYTDHYPSGV